MKAMELANLLCKDVVRGAYDIDSRRFVATNFKYPDGDFVNIYFMGSKNSLVISDLGTTSLKLKVDGVELSESRTHLISAICKLHDVEYKEGRLFTPTDMESLGDDTIQLCQAITRISNLQYEARPTKLHYLDFEVNEFMKEKITPIRPFSEDWHHPRLDPHKAYPVDYHLNGNKNERNVFVVSTPQKANLVAAVCNFFKANKTVYPSLSILDNEAKFSKTTLRRIQLVSTELLFGLKKNENRLLEFAEV